MKRRTVLAMCCAGLLSMPAFADDKPKPPACCAKKAAKDPAGKTGKLRCSLTGKEVEKCCCEPRDGGKLHCTLADKDVDTCCCTEIKEKAETAQAK